MTSQSTRKKQFCIRLVPAAVLILAAVLAVSLLQGHPSAWSDSTEDQTNVYAESEASCDDSEITAGSEAAADSEAAASYKDLVAPEITLTDGAQITVEAGTDYIEPGYTASDDCDGDLTDAVTITGSVDSHTIGTYELTYTVEDSSQNPCVITRTVTVADTTAPQISLSGDSRIYLLKGSSYTDAGASATDTYDGDVSASLQTENPVNPDQTGVYTVRYSVTDSSGNTGTASRTVYVYEKQPEIQTVIPDQKAIYLTFDDGPGRYTQKLLDVLDEYNVKVTFFVTNQYPDYQDLIGEEYDRGHTVAIHSYSHDYSKIYASEEAFYQDIEQMNNICFAQTGVRATILRFPGGSSNTVSKKYCSGIMTALTESVGLMGYQYADWNVSSGDAGETTSTAKVVSNVTSGVKNHDISVVLQHDTQGFSVDAVEEIIVWGLANGYTFLPLEDTSPMAHHRVGN